MSNWSVGVFQIRLINNTNWTHLSSLPIHMKTLTHDLDKLFKTHIKCLTIAGKGQSTKLDSAHAILENLDVQKLGS